MQIHESSTAGIVLPSSAKHLNDELIEAYNAELNGLDEQEPALVSGKNAMNA